MLDEELRIRLAEAVVEALEVGDGKQEWDVVDELFEAFGIVFHDVEAAVPRHLPGRAKTLRKRAASQLADAAPSANELLNVVVRCGGRFIAMLEATYSRLARHAATTTGASETFRLERSGVDEAQLTISPAFLEQVRRVSQVLRPIPVGRVDEAAIRAFTGWDGGELYGGWPLHDTLEQSTHRLLGSMFPIPERLRLADAVLHLCWLGPVLRERAETDASWVRASARLEVARGLAERLVAAAEAIVRSHVAHLDALADTDIATAAAAVYLIEDPDRLGSDLAQELDRFRADRTLGAMAHPDFVHGVDEPSLVGLRGDLEAVVFPVDDYRSGSGVSSLAGLVTMWRRGLWATRRRPQLEEELLDAPATVEAWLASVSTASQEATAWLEHDVLDVTGTADITQQVDALKEFLNLPLWRQRHLLYEVWVLCATLDACEAAHWEVELRGLSRTDGVWVLSVGQTDEPTATLRQGDDDSLRLDVWREPARRTGGGVLTPDVTISTPSPYVRDLVVVEAKDRWKMAAGHVDPRQIGSTGAAGARTALGVARRYAEGLHPVATWVCNHCDFRQSAGPEVNHGDTWTDIHLADQFRPGEVPEAFTKSVRAALSPPQPIHADATDDPGGSGLCWS